MLNQNIDEQALRKAIENNSGYSYELTINTRKEIERYIQGGNFEDFSEQALKELSGLYYYISESYRVYSNGKYLPNVFVTLGY